MHTLKEKKNYCTRSLDRAKAKRITNKTAKCNVFLTYAELRTDSNINKNKKDVKKREGERERERQRRRATTNDPN